MRCKLPMSVKPRPEELPPTNLVPHQTRITYYTRIITVMVFIVATLFGVTCSAQAAHWQVTLKTEGSFHSEMVDGTYHDVWEGPWEETYPWYPYLQLYTESYVQTDSQGYFPAASTWSRGKLTVVFDWISNEVPPIPAPSKATAILGVGVAAQYSG